MLRKVSGLPIFSLLNNKLNNRFLERHLSSITESVIDPGFVTGFTDGEGSFMISILKNSERRLGWGAAARFEITLHKRDQELLNKIHTYFKGVGIISIYGENKISYRVNDLNQLNTIIIPHFQKYHLNTKKRADFELFSNAVTLISKKEHLTEEGLSKLVSIKASMNLGLSEILKTSFPLCKPLEKPQYIFNNSLHPQWIAGFASAEGYFGVKLLASSTIKTGTQVKLIFQLTQHSRDEQLLKSLIDYFKCGKYYLSQKATHGDFQVFKLSDLMEIIIPFFQNNQIQGEKAKDFYSWCKVACIVKNKQHLTEKGLEQIRIIRNNMNKNRY